VRWSADSGQVGYHDYTAGMIKDLTVTPQTSGAEGTYVDYFTSATTEAMHIIEFATGVTSTNTADRRILLDIALLIGGTRYVVIRQLDVGAMARMATVSTTPAGGPSAQFQFPCYVPSGSNISVRATSNVATTFTIQIGLKAIRSAGYGLNPASGAVVGPDAHPDAYGATLASWKGVVITPSATANTFGTAVAIGGTTNHPYAGFVVGLGCNGNTAQAARELRIQLTGVSGSPVYYDGIFIETSTVEDMFRKWPPNGVAWLRNTLPAGTQVYARCMGSTASGAAITVTLNGLRK
jgi:hypothetical protein